MTCRWHDEACLCMDWCMEAAPAAGSVWPSWDLAALRTRWVLPRGPPSTAAAAPTCICLLLGPLASKAHMLRMPYTSSMMLQNDAHELCGPAVWSSNCAEGRPD